MDRDYLQNISLLCTTIFNKIFEFGVLRLKKICENYGKSSANYYNSSQKHNIYNKTVYWGTLCGLTKVLCHLNRPKKACVNVRWLQRPNSRDGQAPVENQIVRHFEPPCTHSAWYDGPTTAVSTEYYCGNILPVKKTGCRKPNGHERVCFGNQICWKPKVAPWSDWSFSTSDVKSNATVV